MYYVLFNHTTGERERDFQECESEAGVINFLHEKYKEMIAYQIIEVSAQYRLGLIVTEQFIKSTLEKEEVKLIEEIKEKEILQENKKALENIEGEEELTDEEKDKATLEKAEKLIKREGERLKVEKKDWKKCSKCNRRPVAPWNTKGICSTCQKVRKTNRPYKRKLNAD